MKKAEELTHKEGLELEARIKSCQEKRNKLGRTVNTKAQSMFEQEEKQVWNCAYSKLFFSSIYFSVQRFTKKRKNCWVWQK